jgi:carbon storage regulator
VKPAESTKLVVRQHVRTNPRHTQGRTYLLRPAKSARRRRPDRFRQNQPVATPEPSPRVAPQDDQQGQRCTITDTPEVTAMLVLKQDEKIIIGDSITLMVIAIQGDKVRLGIEAPKDVSIHREEVYQAIQRERETHAHHNSATA